MTFSPDLLQRKVALSVLFLMIASVECFAQAARPERGVMPTGSYAVSDIENINVGNGNLNLSIPLASLPPIAGGKIGFTVRAEYNSKGWDTVRQELQSDPTNPATKYVVTHLQQSGVSGWRVGGNYQISFEDISWDHDWLAPPPSDPEYNLLTQNRWSKVMVVTPDGATHELRPLDYPSYADSFLNHNYLRGYYKDDPNTTGTALRYYSYDGSHLWARIDPSPLLYSGGAPSWVIYLPDGTRVEQANGVQRIIDTNGNKVKIWTDGAGTVWTTHYQDEQTGREIRYVYDSAGNAGQGMGQVQYQTVGGTWMTIILNFGTTHVFGKTHAANDPECGESSVYVDSLIPVVRSIVFPQTEPAQPPRQLTFSYNSDTTETVNVQWRPNCSVGYQTITSASRGWGSLSRVVLTGGAIIDYTYALDSQTYAAFDPDEAPRENLTTKTVTHDGTSDTWTYELTPTTATVNSPGGIVVTETRYPSDPAFAHHNAGFGGKEGLVYRTNNSNSTIVERRWSLMNFSGGDNSAPGASVLVSFNPVVVAEFTTLLDDTPAHNPLKMSAKTFQYDFNGNLLTETAYDWFDPALVSRDAQGVPTAVPAGATVLKVTSSSFYNQATTAGSGNVYAKRSISTATPLILNTPQQTTVGPSVVQLSYDGQAYGIAPTVGNVTTKKVWVDVDSKWITSSNTFDFYGNIISATDGRGKITQYFYDDASHALPNRVVVDPQNGSGSQTLTTVYDYYTGLVTSQTDANGQVSTVDYTNQLLGTVDPFGRPGVTKAPPINISGSNQQRRVTATYLDSARQVVVASDLNAENDKLLKTRTTSDQLGRTVLTEQAEDGTNYTISVVNKFLDMGRVTLTSSARRSTAASTDSWTRVTKDNAGRVIEVATFGGATQPSWSGTAGVFTGAVTSTYEANLTTVTDQAGKVRRSMVDALGQLKRVDEPDNNGSLGPASNPAQSTSYSYDPLGNLTTTTQGSQTRSFSYDSCSRLRTTVNPENGTVTYNYDDNGNVLVKTDSRSVSTHFEYDSLNRITRRWYNGSSSLSATTHNSPALPAGVGATSEARFYYDSQSLPVGAPSYSRGASTGRLVAQTYGPGSNGDYFAYDVLGRATLKIQQIGAVNYQSSVTFKLAGVVSTLTYPSGHTVSHLYDQAGRLSSLSGNLGDGTTRTYATGILYSPAGAMVKEEFGTAVPVYNKLFYNSRSQLAEIRASTSYTGPTDYDANRGAIINSYSTQCAGICLGVSTPDNNGNLKRQDIEIPSAPTRSQFFEYDSLNRLLKVRETISAAEQWRQWFKYDRWGNRTIDTTIENGQSRTYGLGINNKAFTVDPANNRLGVPAGQSGAMSYDASGNLTNDTYTGAGNRTYDGENKITSAWGGLNQAQLYSYDSAGGRVKRIVNGVETWQVYGFGSELLAEYAAGGPPTSPQKEFAYRNGDLVVTAQPATVASVNVALAANGATASASSAYGGFAPSGAINGDRKGLFVWQNGYWSTAATGTAWLEVLFNGAKTISEIDVVTIQDNFNAPVEPTDTMTFANYGLSGFDVQYWNGSAWTTISGASVSGNTKIWRKFSFSPLTTTKIRVLCNASVDGFSRLTEVEAWTGPSPAPRFDLALGATATASSSWSSGWGPSAVVNGDRKSLNAGNGGAWVDAGPANSFPDWVQLDFNSNKTIAELHVFTLQDNYAGSSEPTEAMTFTQWGLTGYAVEYWNGSNWVPVPGASVTGNNKVWKKLAFSPLTTSKIRVVANASADGFSRLTEIEAYGPAESSSANSVQWLVTDHLGAPRMIFDQTGSLASAKRHDYLPFGEELVAPISGRSTEQGYAGGDGVRQQFTQKERDSESGLDFFGARYFSSAQGRFTSPDPLLSSGRIENPQSWNHYAYVLNNPLRFFDPLGLYEFDPNLNDEQQRENFRKGLKQAQDDLEKIKQTYGADSNEYKNAKAAVEAFGCERGSTGCSEAEGNNGVVVATGTPGRGAMGHVTTKDGKVYVTLGPEILNSSEMSAEIAHEGSHVVDEKAYNTAGTSVSDYEAEFKAFTVQGAMAEARGYSYYTARVEPTSQHPYGMAFVLYSAGWKSADKNTVEAVRGKRNEAINKALALPKSQGGIYEVTPSNPGRSYYPPKP